MENIKFCECEANIYLKSEHSAEDDDAKEKKQDKKNANKEVKH